MQPQWLQRMAAVLRHRGPDDAGVLQWPATDKPHISEVVEEIPAHAGLVHQRLSIIDLTRGGWQPMQTADGRYVLVFNGEIYNYVELRRELELLGRTFSSDSDTEVLLEGFAAWGQDVLPRLVGMFALAVLDTQERRLTLARDPFGIKPLYYATWSDGLAFASEIKALLEIPHVSRDVAVQPLYDYLRFGLVGHGDGTMFESVRQLPPAHLLAVDLDRPSAVRIRRYWALPDGSSTLTTRDISFHEAADRLRDLFVESVRLHLRSDVPVGAALSGGIDSSAIVAAIRAVGGDAVDIRTFSFVADDPRISEAAWIDVASAAAGATSYRVTPSGPDLVRDLDRLILAQDEPFGSTSIYAQFRVFQLARENGVKVMLDGQGADELLAGYRPYLVARTASLLRDGRIGDAVRLARNGAMLPDGSAAGQTMLKATASLFPARTVHAARRVLQRRAVAPSWLDEQWFRRHGVNPVPESSRSGLHDVLRRDIATTNLPALLRYEDRNSMAFSLESRVPFLVPAIAELVLSLPSSYLLDDAATSKSVFRAAMRGLVPDAILDRRDKIGFVTPERQWLSDVRPWVDSVLKAPQMADVPGLVVPAAREEIDAVLAGSRPFGWHTWRWLNLARWAEMFDVGVPA